MIDELTSSEDLCTIRTLNLEQLLAHVNAVGDVSCAIIFLNFLLVINHCIFNLADGVIETHIFLA